MPRQARPRPKATEVTLGRPQQAPDNLVLNKIQASRLSKVSGLAVRDLEGKSIADLRERFKFELDEFLFFRRVCGRVVKRDLSTGIAYPVPFATVHVQDTDCDFWGYFPESWPWWGWLFPVFCRTEEITSVVTDECGRFCVWIPRFEIDWILRWRRQWICFDDFFVKPSIGDLLERLRLEELQLEPFPRNPNPPDPPGLTKVAVTRGDVETLIGRPAKRVLESLPTTAGFGESLGQTNQVLSAPAVSRALPPPLPPELIDLQRRGEHQLMAQQLNLDPTAAAKIDFTRYHGPFLRCIGVWVAEWMQFYDVPDVSFLVTQDVDGSGTQHVIYEGAFDVPWGGPIPEVTLEASPIAVALPAPECGPSIPCGNTPVIQRVGLMPIASAPTYFDAATGFATRPDKPRPLGLFASPQTVPATAPFEGELQLYGCVHIQNAAFYRIRYSYAAWDGLTPPTPAFSPPVPFTTGWKLSRWAPNLIQLNVTPDANGWYEVLPDLPQPWQPEHLLLNWVTSGAGVYKLFLDVANGSKDAGILSTVGPLTLVIDNNAPSAIFTPGVLGWRYVGAGAFTPLPLSCPLIQRAAGAAIEVRVGATASAGHLRSVELGAGGCGGISPTPPVTLSDVQHWHTGPLNNTWTSTAIFTVPGTAPPGCYSFTITAGSRAFNPAGYDGGFALDYNYNPMPIYANPSVSVAIVNP
jgi:hypothetical protein